MEVTVAETCEAPLAAPLGLAQAPIHVLTRFSYLGLSGWKSEASKDAELLFRPERLRQRLALFRALTLPSLARQTDRGLSHVILTSDQMPDWALSALHDACVEAYGGPEGWVILARPPGKAKAHLRYYLEKQDAPDPVIQIVLDDDDALSIDFIARMRGALPEVEAEEGLTLERLPFFLTYPVGYGLVLRPEEGAPGEVALYRHKYPFINLGLTLLGTKSGKNIFAINHQDAPRRFGHRKMSRRPMFIRALHSFNDSRVTPTERWSKLENWRAEPDLAERFPFLLEADLAGLLANGAE